MTLASVPDVPTGGEIMRAIGRLEKTTDDLSTHLGIKIDRLDDKMDGHADRLTRVEGAHATLRTDFDDFRDQTREAVRQRSGLRVGIASAVSGGVAGVVLGWVFQVISHH